MNPLALAVPLMLGASAFGALDSSADGPAGSRMHVPAAISSVTFTMQGYANLARDVPRFQLGQVYLDGQGVVGSGTSAPSAGTRTRNVYLYFPEATMSTQVLGWSYSATPHNVTQTLVLTVKVVASNDEVDCKVGTVGEITLVDDNRKMRNGQRRDSIAQSYPIADCPSFIQGVTNRDAKHLQPMAGGRGGGQFAEVSISAS